MNIMMWAYLDAFIYSSLINRTIFILFIQSGSFITSHVTAPSAYVATGRCNVAHSIRPPTAHRFLVQSPNSLSFLANVANNVQVWTTQYNFALLHHPFHLNLRYTADVNNILPALLLTFKLFIFLFRAPVDSVRPSVRPTQKKKQNKKTPGHSLLSPVSPHNVNLKPSPQHHHRVILGLKGVDYCAAGHDCHQGRA